MQWHNFKFLPTPCKKEQGPQVKLFVLKHFILGPLLFVTWVTTDWRLHMEAVNVTKMNVISLTVSDCC